MGLDVACCGDLGGTGTATPDPARVTAPARNCLDLSISVALLRRRSDRRGPAVTETEEHSMHPMLFEYRESARVQQRAEMATAVREAKLGEAGWGPVRAVRVPAKLGSGLRRARRVSAGVLAFGQRVPRRLSLPVAATISGRRG
jgi:hypothetical protein